MNIFERIVEVRKISTMSQKDFAIQIDVPYRSLQNYEAGKSENIPHTFLQKLVNETSINANWLITGKGYQYSLDPILLPYFEVLKTICPPSELEQNEAEVIDAMIEIINNRIAKYLVDNLLQKVAKLPLFERIKNFIILTDLGATIRVWSIVEQAAMNTSNISYKEKLVAAAKNGLLLNRWLISQSERDLMAHLVEMWPDDICNYIMANSDIIIEALKRLSPKAEEAIEGNKKMLSFIRRFNKEY